jgi:hypothetical protein
MGIPVHPVGTRPPDPVPRPERAPDDFHRVVAGYVVGVVLALIITVVDGVMLFEGLNLAARYYARIDGHLVGLGFSLFHGLLLGALPVLCGALVARQNRVRVAWQCCLYPLGLGALLLLTLPILPLLAVMMLGGLLAVGITRYVTAQRPPVPPV